MVDINIDRENSFIDDFSFPMCIVNIPNDFKIVYANKAFYDLIEYTKEEMYFKFSNTLSSFFDRETIMKINKSILLKDGSFSMSFEHTLHNKKGIETWVLNEFNRLKSDHDLLYMAFTDITNFKNNQLNIEKTLRKSAFAVSKLNVHQFECNVEDGTIQLETKSYLNEKFGDVIDIHALIQSGLIHPDYISVFKECRDKLLSGENEIAFEFKAKYADDGYHWYKIYAFIVDESEHKLAFGFLQSVHTEKELIYRYLNETQYLQAFLSRLMAYGQIDMSENHIVRVGGSMAHFNERYVDASFDTIVKKFAKEVVCEENRTHYLNVVNRDNLISSYQNGVSYFEVEFKDLVSDTKWMKIYIHLFKNPVNAHVMGLIYLKDISERKRKEWKQEDVNKYLLNGKNYSSEFIQNAITKYIRHMPENTLNALAVLHITIEAEDEENAMKNITSILLRSIRKDDFVSKMQDHEVFFFVKDVTSYDVLKQRIDTFFEQLKDSDFTFSYHMGIAFAQKNQSFMTLYRQASLALQEAMQTKGNNYVCYEKENSIIKNEIETKNANEHYHVSDVSFSVDDFDSFVGEYGDMAYLIDPDSYDLVCANKAFYEKLNKTEEEILGLKCYQVVHHRDTPCPFCVKANWNKGKFNIYRNYNEVLKQEFIVKNRLVTRHGSTKVLALAIALNNNKQVMDSIANVVTENDYILNGIQLIQSAKDMDECIINTLATIAEFYRAEAVRCWKYDAEKKQYYIVNSYSSSSRSAAQALSINELAEVRKWHGSQEFSESIRIESQEKMLDQSIEMYQFMLAHNIKDLQWIPFANNEHVYLFAIANTNANFENDTFMKSFLPFVSKEWYDREQLDLIVYETYHDKLTKVFNRSYYEKQMVSYKADVLESISIVVANINDFKAINNERGFDFGNYCLLTFASMMKKAFYDNDIYRLSGDEFLIVLQNEKQNNVERKINVFKNLILLNCTFTASIGYAWDNVEKNIASLSELATKAMQANKKIYYDNMQQDKNKDRVLVLNGLITAITNHEFEVFVQAKYDNQRNCVFGGEALIRYNHKEYGYIAPIKFIEPLEKQNMIRYIDLFVFEEVCKYVEKWRKEGRKPMVISFNLSRMTLMENDILETMENIFSQYDISKKDIEVEITENDTSVGKAILFQNARKLHDAGYRISLDDFGTNHTNLNILSDIDVDVLKIDKSLIHSLSKNTKKQFILKNVIQMCKDLHIGVIAEGVENKEQEEMLKQLQCHLIQGYLYSKPVPISEFEKTFL